MSPIFASQLGFKFWQTNVWGQNIDDTTLEIYGIVVFIFSVLNKDSRESFFEESVFLTKVKPDVVLGMPFLTISIVNVDFQARDLE